MVRDVSRPSKRLAVMKRSARSRKSLVAVCAVGILRTASILSGVVSFKWSGQTAVSWIVPLIVSTTWGGNSFPSARNISAYNVTSLSPSSRAFGALLPRNSARGGQGRRRKQKRNHPRHK
ncbi:uncharacterized protein TM35_000054730 [Trypanosoma theileri]|uniref:Uncharacterized protein n=1 Tax=Trypanosoma theileri TaxID=67003 RepID=A0A1X0P4L2_9TRYP|nr:uncharacterized protein TM35_000054730 [Trypanosoma theileri]ORC91877.1 hypothetical protein TM35_000054730 [Trypanosoma theileri]